MGEKRDKNLELWTCLYCDKKYSYEKLADEGHIQHTKLGNVVMCPNLKCKAEQLMEK